MIRNNCLILTSSETAARQFRGKQTGSLVKIKNCPGLRKSSKRLLGKHCEYPNEQEVLIAPWTKFKIVNIYYKYKYQEGTRIALIHIYEC